MTADDIRAMSAGRELDAEIATRIMGWRPFKDEWNDGFHCPDQWRDWQEFQPSTNIADSWAVVEKIAKDRKITVSSDETAFLWHCRITGEIFVRAETAPLSICRAALLTTLK